MRFHPSTPILLAALLAGAALGGARVAEAAEPSPSEISVARRLFDEGRAAAEAARWAEAAGKFRRAAAIKDTPGIRFHLARCEEEQGAFVEALLEYDRARELIDGGNRAPDVEKLLPEAREQVRAKVALLTLRVPEDVQNVSVQLDGKAVSASVLGVPMPINPGQHRVQAVAVGRTTYTGQISLKLGEVREVPLELPFATTAPRTTAAAPAAPSAAASSSAASDRGAGPAGSPVPARTLALVAEASLFAVGLGTGVGFSVSRSAASERYDDANRKVLSQVGGSDPSGTACSVPRDGCTQLEQARKDREQAGNIALAGFITAGASAAAFGLTLWLWPHAEPAVHVSAGTGSGPLGLSLSGRF